MRKIKSVSDPWGNDDIAILILRLGAASSLFVRHGFEKIVHFQQMMHDFPDPIKIGEPLSFLFAFFSDSICSLLIAAGLFTRLASAFLVFNLLVAFVFFWHGNLLNIDGELVFVYLVIFLYILKRGGGRYSIDAALKAAKER